MMQNLDLFHFDNSKPCFDDMSHQNGFRFWYARDLMNMLGYSDYSAFKKVINKAMTVCMTLDIETDKNFDQVQRDIDGVERADYRLSKFACYLVAMNGDVKKPGVAQAQAYFITYTEAFKKYLSEAEDVDRISVRGELSEREKSLGAVAKEAGIVNYPFFHNKGYLGLYNMNYKKLVAHKGVPDGRSLLDFMGKEELAANLFRITQTEAKIRNEDIKGQKSLEDAAFEVGRTVRQTMEEISGTQPEHLPITSDLKSVKSTLKSTQKDFAKIEQSEQSKSTNKA